MVPVPIVARRVGPALVARTLAVDVHRMAPPVQDGGQGRGTVAERADHGWLGIRGQTMVADHQKAKGRRAEARPSIVAKAVKKGRRLGMVEASLPVVAVALAAVARRSAHLNAADHRLAGLLHSVASPDSLAHHHLGEVGLGSVEVRLVLVAGPPLETARPRRCGSGSLK